MKLTIDARLIGNSGIGVYIQNILSSSLLDKYDLKVLFRKCDSGYFDNKINNAEMVEYNAELYSVREIIETPFKTFNTDVFWSPHYNTPYFNYASKLKIVTVHDVSQRALYNSLSLKQKIYLNIVQKRSINNSDIIFTVSNFSKSEILKYYKCNEDKVKVVYLGVDHQKFSQVYSDTDKNEILNKYDIRDPYILFVGNVKPHKNLKNALLGFKNFIANTGSTYQDYKFLIAGKRDGFITNDEEIEELLNDSFFKDKLKFTGWVRDEDLALIYQQASIFIFPSIYEGFGLPPLEAMEAGIPVISSNIPCTKEVCGQAAVYFDPLDTQSISEAFYSVLSDNKLKNELIVKGKIQTAKYNWSEMVQKKIDIIDAMA